MIFLGLGGNISYSGQPVLSTLHAAIEAMPAYGIRIDKCSSFYHSRPVPVSDQPWFFNAVISCATHLSPHELLRALLSIEQKFGRVRTDDGAIKNAARTLDLDIIDFDGKIISDDTLDLPHPRMSSRAFIVLPLFEIVPDWKHPASGESISSLVGQLSTDDRLNTVRI
ncbi:MAG: 2-amino-4-hydroxy-6-hydroxymethyldihydropteridine diphosphokinase [Alphaproteobacteria bacterium]|nr:2-amino-4-hydroxy-6-hydroxymethyldihydropteridine diphosphokinase [Alphaproteobacteria bacterium]